MEASSVNLDSQELLQSHIRQTHFAAKMVEQCKLTRFVRRLEDHVPEAERLGKAFSEVRVESSLTIEQTDANSRFAGLDDYLKRPRILPTLSLLYQLVHHPIAERAAMLLADFELHLQAPRICQAHYFKCWQIHIGEAFATLDPGDANVGAKIQIRRQLPLCDCYFERTATRDRRNLERSRRGYFATDDILVRDQPTGHRDL